MPPPPRPFRFLGHLGGGGFDARHLTELARRAESIGYSVLVIPDHLVDQHAPIPLLTTAATVTERIRVGTFVFNVDLRHPAVLAQDLASLDVLSGGRLEIGIGAGWNKPEYDAIGLPFHPVGTRVSRLAEAVAVLKGCLGDGPFSFAGEHYTIEDHDGLPKPVQRPHPPLFIGGGGRRLLTLAGAQADIVGLAPRILRGSGYKPLTDPHSITVAATEEKIGWIRASAGDRFDHIELNTYPSSGPVVVTNHARTAAQERADDLHRRTGIQLTAEEVLDSPHAFIGSIDDLTEKLLALRERFGISSIMIPDIDQLAPVVERLAGR
jgi:probable F420-dependent oxidoreductase